MKPSASVIVPTHNRPLALSTTLATLLRSATLARAEVIVVDDGSSPPVHIPKVEHLRLIRTEGVERSMARNQGAGSAQGRLLIFVDDDMTVAEDFVSQHIQATKELGDILCVGRVSLPPESVHSPFGRFRITIEEGSQAKPRGVVAEENFCTAQNMSIRRETFLSLGGFDPAISSAEDQDLALRFCERGGQIAFLPEADALHRDSNMDIATYCRRHEWGARAMAPFLRRYPHRPENIVRARVAVSLWAARPPGETCKVLARRILSTTPSIAAIVRIVRSLETAGAGDRTLFPLYRALLGLHLYRGFKAGLSDMTEAPPQPLPIGVNEA